MDRAWLTDQLAAGRSIESIAREVGRHPSTVAYWVNKHGLVSVHAARHAPRGGIPREQLEPLVAEGYTVERLAAHFRVGGTTVRHWLKRHGLTTARTVEPAPADRPAEILRTCRRHGLAVHILTARGKRYRCRRCRVEAVSARRRRVKLKLIAEAGGACRLCGYERYPGALQFHHVDPESKASPSRIGGWLARWTAQGPRRRSACSCAPTVTPSWRAESLPLRIRRLLPIRDSRADVPIHRSGVIQSAECSAVNRVVVGSSPTPRALTSGHVAARHR
jgi:transposase-like protein